MPISRLFMTFLETPAMNGRFLEAEAVLITNPTKPSVLSGEQEEHVAASPDAEVAAH